MSQTVNVNGEEIAVEQLRNDWALALMNKGFVVRLKISRWRAQTSLTSEDLGLRFADSSSADFMNKYIRLGVQRLLPPEVLSEVDGLERRARDVLSSYSFDTVWGRFVPYTALRAWKLENDAIRQDFMRQASALGNRYDEIVSLVKRDYRSLAKDVWVRMYPESKMEPTESFIENFVSKVVNKILSREEIFASFKYEVTYFFITVPSLIEDNIAKAHEIKRETEQKDAEAKLENETRQLIAEEYVARKKEIIDGFLEATVVAMRKHVAKLCEGILKSIGKKRAISKITLKEVNRLKEMISKVRLLNFHNDREITENLNELEVEIDKFKGERDDGVVVTKLQKIVDLGTKEIQPQYFSPAIDYLEI
jgi:hypothetical protein